MIKGVVFMSLSLKTYARIYELKQKGAKGRTFAEDQELKKLNLKLKSEKLENELTQGERDIVYSLACAVVVNSENRNQYEKFIKTAIEKYSSAVSKKFSAEELKSIFDEDVKNIRQGYEKENQKQKQNNQK